MANVELMNYIMESDMDTMLEIISIILRDTRDETKNEKIIKAFVLSYPNELIPTHLFHEYIESFPAKERVFDTILSKNPNIYTVINAIKFIMYISNNNEVIGMMHKILILPDIPDLVINGHTARTFKQFVTDTTIPGTIQARILA